MASRRILDTAAPLDRHEDKKKSVTKQFYSAHKFGELVQYFYDFGYTETVKYIFDSRKVDYLQPTEDISKIIELVGLPAGEKSIVRYLNILGDKKPTIVLSDNYNNKETCNDSINVAKLSSKQLTYKNATVANLTPQKLAYLKSFVGVFELDQDNLCLARVKLKTAKIRVLYTAKLPHCNIDFTRVVDLLKAKKIKASVQDIITFLSLVFARSFDGVNASISASMWESFFGRTHVKDAKQVFDDLDILKLVGCHIVGFKSSRYQINLYNKSNTSELPQSTVLQITSIKTLEKLNRITSFKSNFTLKEKIVALERIKVLRANEPTLPGIRNFTNIFLESGGLPMLIYDLKIMVKIINDDRFHDDASTLGIHLTTYSYNITESYFRDYRACFYLDILMIALIGAFI